MVGTFEPAAGTTEQVDDGVMLESLPKEVGVLLIVAGLGGILLPGPIGSPFLILGGVVFFPNLFRRMDRSMQRRFPVIHRQGMKQVRRFVIDLERRYPSHR